MLIYSVLILPFLVTARPDCSRDAYNECVRIADPLVKEARLIFPDNMEDIDLVCRTWNRFVDCLKYYTDNCFTDVQRRQFNRAVENPIESIHQMCTQRSFQAEYLQYAPCIKSTITERTHCGPHYDLLVEQVSQGEITSKSTLCCSHDRFKQCVLKETQRVCDRGGIDGPAFRFSSQIIEKALSFLQEQCYNYIPNSGDCHLARTTDSQTFSDPLTISSSSSEVYPWSTVQDLSPKEILSSRVTPPRIQSTSWLPSSSVPAQHSETPTQMLGARTRPASYGRSSSWSDLPQGGNTVQMYPETSSQTSRPDWATVSSWQPQLSHEITRNEEKSTTWFPAAGDQLVNEVDEPNQQGWQKPKGSGNEGLRAMEALSLTMIMIIVGLC